jgi:hypothetical protein
VGVADATRASVDAAVVALVSEAPTMVACDGFRSADDGSKADWSDSLRRPPPSFAEVFFSF